MAASGLGDRAYANALYRLPPERVWQLHLLLKPHLEATVAPRPLSPVQPASLARVQENRAPESTPQRRLPIGQRLVQAQSHVCLGTHQWPFHHWRRWEHQPHPKPQATRTCSEDELTHLGNNRVTSLKPRPASQTFPNLRSLCPAKTAFCWAETSQLCTHLTAGLENPLRQILGWRGGGQGGARSLGQRH